MKKYILFLLIIISGSVKAQIISLVMRGDTLINVDPFTGVETRVNKSTTGLGYTSGAGGVVTQLTGRTTGVTLNKLSGTITMVSAAVAAAASSTFVLTNSYIAATDIVIAQHNSVTNAASWNIETIAAAGTCTFVVKNVSAASITEATPIKFIVIKASNN